MIATPSCTAHDLFLHERHFQPFPFPTFSLVAATTGLALKCIDLLNLQLDKQDTYLRKWPPPYKLTFQINVSLLVSSVHPSCTSNNIIEKPWPYCTNKGIKKFQIVQIKSLNKIDHKLDSTSFFWIMKSEVFRL